MYIVHTYVFYLCSWFQPANYKNLMLKKKKDAQILKCGVIFGLVSSLYAHSNAHSSTDA